MTATNPSQANISYASIKPGIDTHTKHDWLSRQVVWSSPEPAPKMTYWELMLFMVKQQKITLKLATCDDADAFGFHLHRWFEELGLTKDEVQPQDSACAQGSFEKQTVPTQN